MIVLDLYAPRASRGRPESVIRYASPSAGFAMPEGIITTRTVRATPDNRAVEVIATVDAGEVVPGMFIHIPVNGTLDFTVPVASVSSTPDGCIRLLLECGDEENGADLVMMFNFEDETLQVLETDQA